MGKPGRPRKYPHLIDKFHDKKLVVLFLIDHMLKLLEKGWCQDVLAKTKNNTLTDPENNDAAMVDIAGAFYKTFHKFPHEVWHKKEIKIAMIKVLETIFGRGAINENNWMRYAAKFNDAPGRTHNEILAFMDLTRDIYKETAETMEKSNGEISTH